MKLFKIAFQMDPLKNIDQKTDSTLNNKVKAFGYFFTIKKSGSKYLFKSKTAQHIDLENFKVVLIRQDPPFDLHYITSTSFLEKL